MANGGLKMAGAAKNSGIIELLDSWHKARIASNLGGFSIFRDSVSTTECAQAV